MTRQSILSDNHLIVVACRASVQVLEVLRARTLVNEDDIHAAVARVREGSGTALTEVTATADEEGVDCDEATAQRLPGALCENEAKIHNKRYNVRTQCQQLQTDHR